VSLPGLCEHRCLVWMVVAIYKPHAVSPSNRGRKKASAQQNEQPIAQHSPLLGPGTRRAHMTVIGPGRVCVKWHEGQDFSKRYWTKRRVHALRRKSGVRRLVARLRYELRRPALRVDTTEAVINRRGRAYV
jgi:hypothetical protein